MAQHARRRLLLTGFGAFGDVSDNPSGRVLPALESALNGLYEASVAISARRLEVKFGAIDACHPETYDVVIGLGVDVKTTSIRVETHARNHFIDLAGNARAIDVRQLAPLITGRPLPALPSRAGDWDVTPGTTGSAGTFVCNQTYYALCRIAGIEGYFIHIPNVPPSSDPPFVRALTEVIRGLLTPRTGA